jgi:hypothetical protein
MTTTTIEKTELSRILDEGYGPGAWHGPDLKAALADVGPELAFWRPAPGRHNIAEIAPHHAFTVRNVRGQLSGTTPEPFVLEGPMLEETWFDPAGLSWPEIQKVLEEQQGKLAAAVANTEPDAGQLNLVLGITCHAIYHAGQVQLLKRLQAG